MLQTQSKRRPGTLRTQLVPSVWQMYMYPFEASTVTSRTGLCYRIHRIAKQSHVAACNNVPVRLVLHVQGVGGKVKVGKPGKHPPALHRRSRPPAC